MRGPCWAFPWSRSSYLVKSPSSNLINYRTYQTRQYPAPRIILGCNILAPKVSAGKWIVIISELEQQKHTWAHLLISDQLAVMHSLPLSVVLSMLQRPQDKTKQGN